MKQLTGNNKSLRSNDLEFVNSEGVIQTKTKGGGFVVRVPRTTKGSKKIFGTCITISKHKTRAEAQKAYDEYLKDNPIPKSSLPYGFHDAKEYRPDLSKTSMWYSNNVIFISEGKRHKGYYNLEKKTYYAHIPSINDAIPYKAKDVQAWRYASSDNKQEPIKI